MIRAYVIRLNDQFAHRAVQRLSDSLPTNVKLHEFDAIRPAQVNRLLASRDIRWNYPWAGEEHDMASGLIKKPYQTENPKRRIACFLSHYLLWEKCIKYDEPQIVHEHDAIYYEDTPLPLARFEESRYDIIGLNSPIGATRLSKIYDAVCQNSKSDILRAPEIDHYMVPQGIAGNSAYYIRPSGAAKMISLTKEFGAWPNDALMNRQLVSSLGQTKHYYTYVQGLKSTTST